MKLPLILTMTAFLFEICSSSGIDTHPDLISALPGQPPVAFRQFSGYVPVDDENQRALFFYFAEAEEDPLSKPLVLWLNGGNGVVFISKAPASPF